MAATGHPGTHRPQERVRCPLPFEDAEPEPVTGVTTTGAEAMELTGKVSKVVGKVPAGRVDDNPRVDLVETFLQAGLQRCHESLHGRCDRQRCSSPLQRGLQGQEEQEGDGHLHVAPLLWGICSTRATAGTRADGIHVNNSVRQPGLAWVRYDAAFRRKAALTGNTRWSTINPTLYTMCFAGRALTQKRCELCFAITRIERECAQRGYPDPGVHNCIKVLESAVLAMAKWEEHTRPPPSLRPSGEPCRKWEQHWVFLS